MKVAQLFLSLCGLINKIKMVSISLLLSYRFIKLSALYVVGRYRLRERLEEIGIEL
jgi:hypothetical protein